MALTVSLATMRPPMAAWMGTSNIWRGMTWRSFSVMRRPWSWALERWMMVEKASTGTWLSSTSRRTRSDGS